MHRKPFTLIELLIVVAIIGILASMLLPSLARARQEALLAVCKNNLHQLNVATQGYIDDSDGRLPFSNWRSQEGPGGWEGAGWLYDYRAGRDQERFVETGVLWPYLDSRRVYRCPADVATNRWTTWRMTSYNMNGAVTAFGSAAAFDSSFPAYHQAAFRSDGVFMFGQSPEASWNDGANFPTQIGDTSLPISFRLPERHQNRTNVLFFSGAIKTSTGSMWEYMQSQRPGQFYCNPGSSTGDDYP